MKKIQFSSARQNQAHKAHTDHDGKTRTAEQYAGLKKTQTNPTVTKEIKTAKQNYSALCKGPRTWLI